MIAGIIVAAFFAPPSVLLFVGLVVGKLFDFIKNNIIGSFYVLGAGAFMAGLGVAYNDYHAARLEGTKQDIEETKGIIKVTAEDLSDLQKEKLGSKSTLDAIMELKRTKATALDLSKKVNVMGAMGAKILRNFISNPTLGLPSCKTLNLSNNNLAGEELAELAKSLDGSDILEQFQLQNVDITGNPIKDDFSVDGLDGIRKALAKNFTITDFKYDIPIFRGDFTKTNQNTFAEIQKGIAKETLINLYLHEGLTEKIKAQMASANLTEDQLKKAAENKIRENFKVTNIPHTDNTEISTRIDQIISQNKAFTQFNFLPEQQPNKNYGETYIDIFKMDPERCVMFTSQSDGLKEGLKPKIQLDILQNIFMLLTIQPPNKRRDLLVALFTTTGGKIKENALANIDTVIAILESLQVKEVDQKVIKFLKDNKVFDGLLTVNASEFKKNLEAQKPKLLQREDIDYKLKNPIITAFDLALHPDLGTTEQTSFKKLQLKQLVANKPQKAEISTLKEFLDIYSTVPENELGSIFEGTDLEKFMGLVNADIYYAKKEDQYSQLRRTDLSKEHRRRLLEFYFSKDKKEVDHPNKVELINNILGNKELNGISFGSKTTTNGIQVRNTALYYAFFGTVGLTGGIAGRNPQNFNQLKEALEKPRKAAATKGEILEARALDQPLQLVFKENLSQKYPCLIATSSKEKFEELKKQLETNYELRQFEFPKEIEIDPEVKNYVENISKRNQLRDLLENYPVSSETLKEVLVIYKTIDREYLTAPAINVEKLIELIKHDTYKQKSEVLRNLNEESVRFNFLITCLGNDHEARGIATLASKLIVISPPINSEYFWSIFDWKGTLSFGSHEKWSFETYINKVKELSRTRIDLLPIIQAGWQAYLTSKFDCLKGIENPMQPSSFDLLKKELDGNFDLTDVGGFNF